MEENIYKVYIKIDSNNYIVAVAGGQYPPKDLTNWTEIDEGTSYPKYAHPSGNYFEKPLINDNGCHNYVYKNEQIRETTEEEKQIEFDSFPAPQPTKAELIQQQLDAILLALAEV